MPIRKPNPYAKTLRKNMPSAERRLWFRLKNKQLGDFRFRRQQTIGPYIVDFACIEAKLVIELDGDQHGQGDAPERDAVRDAFLEKSGWLVLRFWNNDVFKNLQGVLDTVLSEAQMNKRRLEIQGK